MYPSTSDRYFLPNHLLTSNFLKIKQKNAFTDNLSSITRRRHCSNQFSPFQSSSATLSRLFISISVIYSITELINNSSFSLTHSIVDCLCAIHFVASLHSTSFCRLSEEKFTIRPTCLSIPLFFHTAILCQLGAQRGGRIEPILLPASLFDNNN